MYVRELHVRYRLRRVRGPERPPDCLLTPQEAASAFMRLLKHEPIEVGGLYCLSARNHVLAYHELSRGTVDATIVHPRDVFKVAFLANATAVIVGHNHPSGDPTPSPGDVELTSRLERAAEVVGIELFDHVIVAGDQYFSFKEAGRL